MTKNVALERTVAMPGATFQIREAIKPRVKDKTAKITLKDMKVLKFFDRFRAVTAGIIASALISKIPTKLMPTAIVRAIKTRRSNCILVWEIFETAASSGAMADKSRGLRNFRVVKIIRIASAVCKIICESEKFSTLPKKVSKSSVWGISKAPTASAVTNKTPVIDSIASLVLFSIRQISKTPRKSRVTPPKSG